jgi:signal transduction histidine kinase/DNA-binding NarL/FixJ family response regulator
VRPLRVLVVEDSEADAGLAMLELARVGLVCASERVDTRQSTAAALDRGPWDVVIADYRIPGFSGLEALAMVQERRMDVPFVIVSGAIGEETAVEAMLAGAHDYVLKDNLMRLGAAVTRELREAQVRKERRQALDAVHVMARRSAFLAEASARLASSLDFEDTLAVAGQLTVPDVADWCMISMRDQRPGGLRTVLSHADPVSEARGRAHLARYPQDPVRGVAVRVLRTRQPELTTPDDVLCTAAPPEESRALLRALGHHAGVCMALVARDETLGAMTLVWSAPRPGEPDDQLGFVQDVAARVAVALENATLYRQAREAIQVREEFLSVASHELNTPVATLTLELDELLRRELNGAEPPGGEPRTMAPPTPTRVSLTRARRQLDRLARLVGNLLDLSQLGAHHLHLHPTEVDLSSLAREVVEQFGQQTARAACSVELRAEAPVVGHWDPSRLVQVVSNLMSNACKFGAGKPITVSVDGTGDRARLSVEDHGVGIAAEDQGRIFEPFGRAAEVRHYGGLGLGLYITRQLVEAHGGTIEVDSASGAGTTFRVELPRGGPPPDLEAPVS